MATLNIDHQKRRGARKAVHHNQERRFNPPKAQLDLGVDDLASRFAAAIPLMYVVDLSPFVLGLGVLLHGGIRAGFRWPGLAARYPA